MYPTNDITGANESKVAYKLANACGDKTVEQVTVLNITLDRGAIKRRVSASRFGGRNVRNVIPAAGAGAGDPRPQS